MLLGQHCSWLSTILLKHIVEPAHNQVLQCHTILLPPPPPTTLLHPVFKGHMKQNKKFSIL